MHFEGVAWQSRLLAFCRLGVYDYDDDYDNDYEYSFYCNVFYALHLMQRWARAKFAMQKKGYNIFKVGECHEGTTLHFEGCLK